MVDEVEISTSRKCNISSRVKYLIGVPEKFIISDNGGEVILREMSDNKNARVIRNLCILRSCLMKYAGKITKKLKEGFCSLGNMSELIDSVAVQQLYEDGIDMFKRSKNDTADNFVMSVNRMISDKINNCSSLFPMWFDWEYMRSIFNMPNGFTAEGVNSEKQLYFENRSRYPYQMYISWDPEMGNDRNILYDDSTIVPLLYKMNGKEFTEWNRVCDAGDNTKNGIYSYIDSSDKVVIAVDCENSDPYKMCAALRNLDKSYVNKISKIILVDDVNASSAWKIIEGYTDIPVDYTLIERIKKDKSLVDITLATAICKEHYTNGVDSFILFTSDSDYWGVTSVLPDVKFLFMVERASTANEFKEALRQVKMPYCYLDDFYVGSSTDIKFDAITMALTMSLQERNIDANALLNDALKTTRAELTEAEYSQFFKKFFGKLSISVSSDGIISVGSK